MSEDLAEARDNTVLVQEPEDLGPVENGRHQLESMTAYEFDGFISSPNGIELQDFNPLVGLHGGIDGFIHTGGGTAIYGREANYFQRDMLVSAPGGQVLDLQGTGDEEVLVESTSAADPAGMGDAADLGVIDGMRVPTFKGCNFEDFEAGLTFTGISEKIFFSECPFRSVDSAGVTILDFDANFETEVVDITDCYVKNVQADTEVVRVDQNATLTEIFQYRGVTHEQSVTEDNILTGAAGVDEVGYRVRDSFPLRDSKAVGDFTLDSSTTVTINTQAADKTDAAAYSKVTGATTGVAERKFTLANTALTYIGLRDRISELDAGVSVGTGNTDTIAVAWFVNGNIIQSTATRLQMSQQGGSIAKFLSSTGVDVETETNDEFDIRIANLDSTTDVNVGELNVSIST